MIDLKGKKVIVTGMFIVQALRETSLTESQAEPVV
jgi:hypothetical protein